MMSSKKMLIWASISTLAIVLGCSTGETGPQFSLATTESPKSKTAISDHAPGFDRVATLLAEMNDRQIREFEERQVYRAEVIALLNEIRNRLAEDDR